jgi:hypothetical protein
MDSPGRFCQSTKPLLSFSDIVASPSVAVWFSENNFMRADAEIVKVHILGVCSMLQSDIQVVHTRHSSYHDQVHISTDANGSSGVQLGQSATAAADEVGGCANLEQRVIGGFDALHARDGIKDDMLLLLIVISDNFGKRQGANMDTGTILGPVDGDIVDHILVVGDLGVQLERDGSAVDSLRELVEEEAVGFSLEGVVVEVIDAGIGQDEEAPEPSCSLAVDELECGEAKVGLSRETGGRRLRSLHEGKCRWVGGEEGLDRGGGGGGLCGGGKGIKELEELVARASGKGGGGMGDDISMDAGSEVEADGKSTGISVWVSIG